MPSEISTLLESIQQNGSLIVNGSEPMDETARTKLLAAATSLIHQLEKPGDILERIGWGEPSRTAALRVVFDLGLFAKLDSITPSTSAQLTEGIEADPVLVARAMKHLAAHGLVKEAGPDKYLATEFTAASTGPFVSGGLVYSFEGMIPTFQGLPEFLAKTQYRVPMNADNGPVQYGLKTEMPFFGVLQTNAKLGGAFNNFMGSLAQIRPSWTDFYPCEERLIAGSPESEGPLVVDVGGGLGHDISAFHRKFPNAPGRLVLQDTSTTMAQIQTLSPPLPVAIKAMEHNFFTPQPTEMRHSRAYFLHFILHDWTDNDCRVILGHLKDAMKPGYSRLLINETVMLDEGAPWQHTSLDWTMMAMLVSRERTESQWRALLESVGLRVTGIWSKSPTGESVIEAEVAET